MCVCVCIKSCIGYKELTDIIMKAEKSQDLQSEGRDPGKIMCSTSPNMKA